MTKTPPILLLLFLLLSMTKVIAAPASEYHPHVAPPHSDSPEFYYNEALTAKEAGNFPVALLALRRALILDPTLLVAQEQLQEVVHKMGLPQEITWKHLLAARISPEELIIGGSIVGWVAAFVAIALFFVNFCSSKTRKKWGFLALALFFFFLGHGMAFLGTMIDPRTNARHKVMVLPQEYVQNPPEKSHPLALRATPVDTAAPMAELRIGTCVTLLSRHGVWSYVSTSSGQKGWIASSALEPLIPRDVMPLPH